MFADSCFMLQHCNITYISEETDRKLIKKKAICTTALHFCHIPSAVMVWATPCSLFYLL